MNLFCWLGRHSWVSSWAFVAGKHTPVRTCWRCQRTQQIHFYSNRTHEWLDVEAGS